MRCYLALGSLKPQQTLQAVRWLLPHPSIRTLSRPPPPCAPSLVRTSPAGGGVERCVRRLLGGRRGLVVSEPFAARAPLVPPNARTPSTYEPRRRHAAAYCCQLLLLLLYVFVACCCGHVGNTYTAGTPGDNIPSRHSLQDLATPCSVHDSSRHGDEVTQFPAKGSEPAPDRRSIVQLDDGDWRKPRDSSRCTRSSRFQ